MNEVDFSVVIPTYQRPHALLRCVEALEQQAAGSPTFEVIVVDDGSDETLDALLRPVQERLRLRLVRQAHAGPGAARNQGIQAATGRWIAFTDDDCLPDPGWLAGFAARFAETPDCGLGGRTLNQRERNLFSAAHQRLVDYVTRPRRNARNVITPAFFASNNLAFPLAPLRAIGGFDTSFPFAAGEDRDLCDRWLAAGHVLAEVPQAVVRHDHEIRFGRFCSMHYRYGRGARRFRRKQAERAGRRVHLEPASFYLRLVTSPLSDGTPHAVPVFGALVLSQLCHSAGYARECIAERR